ncbi:MAG TPA: T9SS type A sorting domain-containing protein, partial [Ferruginibacter sp.]|nr:T9SS type A sorting domain-containing protein [Ferruginibacter sp.]
DKSLSSLIASNNSGINVLAAPSDTLRILSSLTFGTSGATVNSGNNLTLVSRDTATAAVGQMTGSNAITNKVTVERYITAGRKWRFLSVPINTGFQNVKQSWQEGATSAAQNPVPGYGMLVTDSLGTWAANGFDGLSVGVTMKKHTFVPALNDFRWVGIATTSKDISDVNGYMTFVRGNRGMAILGAGVTTTILRATGTIKQGTQAGISVPTSEFVSIGNPYPSAIDMRYINKPGAQEFFYTWDPKLSGLYTVGGYQVFSKNIATGNYEVTPGGGSYPAGGSVYNTIESGQAFFIRGAAGGTLTFEENDKAVGSKVVNFTPGAEQKFRANMHVINPDGSTLIADGILVDYNDGYNRGVDYLDAIKPANTNENVGIRVDNKLLVIERRNTIAADDTIRLNVSGVRVQDYKWELIAQNMDADGRSGFFIDKYLGTSTPLNLNGTNTVRFAIQNIPGSYASDRFMVVFKQTTLLPATIPAISATRNSDKTISVNWKIAHERNIQQYQVERSNDGIRFTSIASQLPVANNGGSPEYAQNDASPLYGYNYYRIKALNTGTPMYSAIVKVDPLQSESYITIYPNPVSGGKMNIHFENLPAGDYKVELYNTIGQLSFNTRVQIGSISESKLINLAKMVAKGNYQLNVTGEDGTKRVHAVIIE